MNAPAPAVQRDIVRALEKSSIARLIGQMTPGQAADIVAVLPAAEKRVVLGLLKPEDSEKIQAILAKHEVNILNFTTTRFLTAPADATVAETRGRYRDAAKIADVRAYLCVVTDARRLGQSRRVRIAGHRPRLAIACGRLLVGAQPEAPNPIRPWADRG